MKRLYENFAFLGCLQDNRERQPFFVNNGNPPELQYVRLATTRNKALQQNCRHMQIVAELISPWTYRSFSSVYRENQIGVPGLTPIKSAHRRSRRPASTGPSKQPAT